jgi:hypothetical protein
MVDGTQRRVNAMNCDGGTIACPCAPARGYEKTKIECRLRAGRATARQREKARISRAFCYDFE